jgi:hypothetical protein
MGLTVVAAIVGSCGDGPGRLQDPNEPEEPTQPAGLTVSEPVEAGVAPSPGALASSMARVAYVSACPGTFPNAETITLTNLRTGESRSVTPVNGGFDPVGLEAEAGDEIEIVVGYSDGSSTRFLVKVPKKKRPRVVRTFPPRDAIDILLSVRLIVVFSEPIDDATVTAETIRLELGGDPVDGTRSLSADAMRAELIPAAPLQPATNYTLIVTEGIRDLDGDSLEDEVEAPFRTEPPPPPPNDPPTVSISAPEDGASFTQGHLIQFTATATDPEDGDVSDGVVWVSDMMGGYVGTDPACGRLDLAVGDHTIVATAPDRRGAVGSDTVAISVTPAGPSGYSVTDLGVLSGALTASIAIDLGEPTAGTLRVVGWSQDISGNFGIGPPTLWTVTLDGAGGVSGIDVAGLPLPAGYVAGRAWAVTADGDIIVGIAGVRGETDIPIMWSGPGWSLTELTLLPGHSGGSAYDINGNGTMIVGWSERTATLWDVSDPPTSPMALPSPLGGGGFAYAVNNEGYVAGVSETPWGNYDPWHAVVWRPPYRADRVCDLHTGSGWPWGEGKTSANEITDVNPSDGTVLVTGTGRDDAVIWQVNVADCSIVSVTEIGNMVEETTRVMGVRTVDGGWESAGRHGYFDAFAILPEYTPVVWRLNGGLVEVVLPGLTSHRGAAAEMNGAGLMVGWAEAGGHQHAAIWTR